MALAFQGVLGSLCEFKSNLDESGAWHSPCGRYGQGCRFHKPAAGWVSLLCHFLLSEGPLVPGAVGEAATDPPLLLGSGKKEEDGQGSFPLPHPWV